MITVSNASMAMNHKSGSNYGGADKHSIPIWDLKFCKCVEHIKYETRYYFTFSMKVPEERKVEQSEAK